MFFRFFAARFCPKMGKDFFFSLRLAHSTSVSVLFCITWSKKIYILLTAVQLHLPCYCEDPQVSHRLTHLNYLNATCKFVQVIIICCHNMCPQLQNPLSDFTLIANKQTNWIELFIVVIVHSILNYFLNQRSKIDQAQLKVQFLSL